MREIKFRAWDIDSLTMVYQNNEEYLIGYDGVDLYLAKEEYCGEDLEWSTVEKVVFMQYTGLKDKNGTEIYEGDIVSWNNKIGYIGFLKQEMGYCIIFKNTDSRLGHRNIGSGYDFNTDIEVIGNIYEHSELLEVKQ